MVGDGCAPGATEVEAFIARWRISEGAERASFPSFIGEFCELLRMERPQPPTSDVEAVAYRFEYPVRLSGPDGSGTTGRIDLYRKRCFVMEAKQSRLRGQPKEILPAGDTDDEPAGAPRGRRGADRGLDVMMLNAKRQAEQYCRALPASHGWPPFVILCDVGHCFEFYADFSGQGKNYAQFPDRHRFRVYLEDLRDPAIRAGIARIWSDPTSLDPSRQAALATRQIAQRLALVSKALERRHDPEDVALFLMRCVFTMFAEDVRLIPADSFKRLLRECLEAPKSFKPLVEDLWRAMDLGRYSSAVRAELKRFNGRMFAEPQVFALGRDGIAELLAAAEHDWSLVDPAIFGTLLEQALEPAERARLGAHYTPRAYVERLVVETVIAPLRDDWRNVLTAAQQARDAGSLRSALALVEDFNSQLRNTRVLDPACGTGNFLHVAQDLMKRLEGEVLEVAAELGATEQLGGFGARGVGPWQFFGIDANRRAVAIADLMLWIGYLQWHLRTRAFAPTEPILEELTQIVPGDALLAWDDWPVPLVEGGREVTPRNPRRPDWPEVEFIVGNPPFIGGKDLRGRLGESYVGALRAAYPQMNESADLVMYWWDRAAELLVMPETKLRRFGFVTTNSITQLFQRRVVERHLGAKKPISLLLAIADHPWTKADKDAAAVRIAMTVAETGRREGRLLEVIAESGLDTDQPRVDVRERLGVINSDLSIGTDVTRTTRLLANEGLCSPGVKLHGAGFIVTPAEAEALGLGRRPGLDDHIRHYRNGRDLTAHSRDVMAIDLFGLTATEVRERFPEVYQHVKLRVKEERDASGQLVGRDANNRASYRELWWLFGEPRKELRPALAGLQRYIATVETAKHRVFQFLDASILPDNMLVAVSLSDAFHLGVLSSRVHCVWALQAGGWLGIGNDPRYSKSLCFDPFPFPEVAETQKQVIRASAEALDALRKDVLERHPNLTLTRLYNVREAILAGRPLSSTEADIRDRGLVLILNEHHEAIDAAVASAYGLPADAEDETILAMLVALNRDRAREEERGTTRWLRPDYQRPRFGREAAVDEQIEVAELLSLPAPRSAKPVFPTQPVERVAAVLAVLATATMPLDAAAIAQRFRQGLKVRGTIAAILISLARVGEASTMDGGGSFVRRFLATG
ncbi:Type II restriction/modification system, DNA methylase subunit YeeA [Bosea lupini]|uniref:site-specific DNA-methyltransferase (adenine-specific) n=1 Tax=Bosea lupini TaxID=1036779 RepID=A0A1H7RC08_9HYPH|nr:DNA methyltransferase [Bosea lupini]SEL57649.1 Type II restriction/modification system, DNA methylase subunit YeeA [Bosea lupini]